MSEDRDSSPLGGAPTIVSFPTEPTPPLPAGSEPARKLPAGTILAGRYAVESLIGRGGMGAVYVASDRLLGEPVALKLLDLGPGSTESALDKLRGEVRLARKVTHPNVVRIHDLVEQAGEVFLTMELVLGTDLRRILLLEGGWLSAERTARIAMSLAEALAAAHAVGVVHRDLKPENVLLDPTGRVLLSDFGIAVTHDPSISGRVEEGVALGTPAYMAPEQVEGRPVGPAADIFALGVVLFEALSGSLPFQGDSPVALAIARLHHPPADLGRDRSVPLELAELTRACLRVDPSERPSAADVSATLRRFLEGRASHLADADGGGWASAGGVTYNPGKRALACLGFAYRGPAEHEYLGEGLANELVGVLSRTRNLRVLSVAATRHLTSRDPRRIANELGVDFVVDGTVELRGSDLRIDVRLADAAGTQLASERYDLGWVDVLHAQELAGTRIAEALRAELVTRAAQAGVSDDAVGLYLQARRAIRASSFAETPKTVELLERALSIAPRFAPALAAYALSTVHMWFLPQGTTTVRDWKTIAQNSVALALEHAPDLAETHVAAARLASHSGDLHGAVHALRRAIEIAPTSPEAQTLVGQLECETGRVDVGLARLKMAYDLEPTSNVYLYEAARITSFAGDKAGFRRRFEEIKSRERGLVEAHLGLRHALWWHDEPMLDEVVAMSTGTSLAALFRAVARAVRREVAPRETMEVLSLVMTYVNPRLSGLLRQIAVEIYLRLGDYPAAVFALREAHKTLLYDVTWLERCPLLTPIRSTRDLQAVLAEVRMRCDEVWSK